MKILYLLIYIAALAVVLAFSYGASVASSGPGKRPLSETVAAFRRRLSNRARGWSYNAPDSGPSIPKSLSYGNRKTLCESHQPGRR